MVGWYPKLVANLLYSNGEKVRQELTASLETDSRSMQTPFGATPKYKKVKTARQLLKLVA